MSRYSFDHSWLVNEGSEAGELSEWIGEPSAPRESRNHPCPCCDMPNKLTLSEYEDGYDCEDCADECEASE